MTTTIANNTITITTTINATDFFNAITGSDFYGCNDFVAPQSLSVDEENKTITLSYYDVNNGVDENGYYNTITETLTLEKLAIAYNTLVSNNQTHCGGHSLTVEDSDSCFGYMVLQQSCYGELMF
jgi:hypothetical protein